MPRFAKRAAPGPRRQCAGNTCLRRLLVYDQSRVIDPPFHPRYSDASGPLHGHQIPQQAQFDRTESWTDIQVGSVYGALKRLANEDLVREVRRERVGNRPERTVYGITAEGRRALAAVRDAGRLSSTQVASAVDGHGWRALSIVLVGAFMASLVNARYGAMLLQQFLAL